MKSTYQVFGKILIGRHGETEWNSSGRIMGQSDSPLTIHGHAQIQSLTSILLKHQVDRIVSSPLGRAAVSACIYSLKLSIPIYFMSHIAELSAGTWQGRFRKEVAHEERPFRSTWHDRPPHGESYADAEYRVRSVMNELVNYSDETVLIIGHAGINKVLLKMRLGLDPDTAFRVVCPHDIVYVVDSSDHISVICQDSREGNGLIFQD